MRPAFASLRPCSAPAHAQEMAWLGGDLVLCTALRAMLLQLAGGTYTQIFALAPDSPATLLVQAMPDTPQALLLVVRQLVALPCALLVAWAGERQCTAAECSRRNWHCAPRRRAWTARHSVVSSLTRKVVLISRCLQQHGIIQQRPHAEGT